MGMITVPYYETSNFCFSNFSAHTIELKGVKYPTVEHARHAQKFSGKTLRRRIVQCSSPIAVWNVAHGLKSHWRKDGADVKVGVLMDITRAKVAQHDDMQAALKDTGSEEIMELNPHNAFWGGGIDNLGQNRMGRILMKIRDELKQKSQG